MEIEHEVLDIEDLFLSGKDKKTRIKITIEDRGEFQALVTPVTYGQVKKMGRTSEEEVADYVLSNHFFKMNEETFTVDELNMLPAGVLKGVVEVIMKLSGLNITDEDIEVF